MPKLRRLPPQIKMLSLLEEFFAVLMLIYLSSGIIGFWSGDSPLNLFRLENDPLLLAIQIVMYVATFGFAVLHWRKFINVLRPGGWLLALALLAVISSLWSTDSSFTLRRSLVVTATTVFGVYFGSRYELSRQVRLVGWTFIILAALSVGCSLWLPHYGIDQQFHQHDWQGVFGQKNLLGKAMAVAIIVLWSAKGVLGRGVRIVALPTCAVLLLMSGSRAALLVCIVVLMMLPIYPVLRNRVTTLVPLGIAVLVIVAGTMLFVIENISLVLAFMGKSATLTRRTEVWSAVWVAISDHMLLGYGFSAFWAGLHGESARLAGRLGFVARHAHNGFLDLWLELGIAGLALFVAGYLQAVGNGIALLRMGRDRSATWPLQYLAFLLLYDLAEGPILRPNSLYWALYVAVVVATAIAVRREKALRAACAMHASLCSASIEQQGNHLPRRPAACLGNLHPQAG